MTAITPIDTFLRRQQDLSAVERFSSLHDADTVDLHAGWYRSLLPATPPAPGQQYRFEVDLDSCTACKSCVSACGSLNGLDEGEAWRTVGSVTGLDRTGPTQQTVTSACHHCADPACLAGCPVDAYEKDPITGIVAHLDDQCIGCSYCTWTCPYDVPVFSERLGVVRKCDMCRGRLAEGEAPACVQACPNGAITIGIVEIAELRVTTGATDRLVPGAPSSALTVPTTLYRRRAPLDASAEADDAWVVEPNHAHRPLVVMLVATQLAVGLLFGLTVSMAAGVDGVISERVGAAAAAALTLGGIAASTTHLGRPLLAWRAVLGVRHSWLSREILAFGAVAPLVLASVVELRFTPLAALAGLGAVGCSAMIYIATGRRWWAADRTVPAFARTVMVGASVVGGPLLAVAVLAAEAIDRHGDRRSTADLELAGSAKLVGGPLARFATIRTASRVGAAALALGTAAAPWLWPIALGAAAAGELAARSVYFQAMTAPRMPGKAHT